MSTFVNTFKQKQIEKDLELDSEEAKLSKSITQSEQLNQQKQGNNLDKEDPYLNLGYGMIAYFRMLSFLILGFIIFTILSIPALAIYAKYNGLEGLSNYSKAKYSIGNMGFSGPNCVSTYVGLQYQQKLYCQVGQISQLFYTGLIPSSIDANQKDFCGDSSTTTIAGIKNCNAYLNTGALNTFL